MDKRACPAPSALTPEPAGMPQRSASRRCTYQLIDAASLPKCKCGSFSTCPFVEPSGLWRMLEVSVPRFRAPLRPKCGQSAARTIAILILSGQNNPFVRRLHKRSCRTRPRSSSRRGLSESLGRRPYIQTEGLTAPPWRLDQSLLPLSVPPSTGPPRTPRRPRSPNGSAARCHPVHECPCRRFTPLTAKPKPANRLNGRMRTCT